MQAALGMGFEALCRKPDSFRGQQVGCECAEAFIPMRGRGAIKPYNVLP